MPRNIFKYLGGFALALGFSIVFFTQPAKAMPGSLTQWLESCNSPGSCSTWAYAPGSSISIPQGGWVSTRMHNRWVTSPGQLPLYQDGFIVSDIIMDWGYTCPAGFSCYMLPYYAQGTTPWTVNGRTYNYLAWDSVSNFDYTPTVTFNTTAATPPGTYRIYFTVFENPSISPPAAMPPNSGCQFPAPGCLGPVETYLDITVVSPATNGVCGTANNKTYPSGSTAYTPDTQCAAGVSDNTAFPGPGATVTWVCKGTGGGSDSPTCRASQAPPAQCVNITAPDTVTAGQTFSASVTMKNINNTTWWNNTEAAFKNSVAWYFPNDPYRLGSWTPSDNNRWGLTRVDMPMKSIGTSGRYLRIRTPSSTSWVAWREITLYDSAGNRVTPVNATVSSDWRGANYAVGPGGVYDGQGWTVWNSGTYSGWIILDYGRVVDFAALWLLPEQTPNPPNTTHYIEVSNDNINYTQIASVNAQNLRSDVWYIVDSYAKNNNNITYNFTATAPTTPGTYAFNWNMVHEGVEWFPDASACKKDIVVTANTPTCGTDNGKTLGTTPTNLCGVGTSSNLVHNTSSPGGWTWQCSTGGAPVSCSANEYCANFITSPASGGACNNLSASSYTASWTLAPGVYSVQKFRAGPNLSDVNSGCGGGTCVAALDLPNNQTSYSLSGLTSSTTYYNRVVSYCTNPDGSTGENVNYKSYVWSCTTTAACTPLTYKPATSGFSLANTGPAGSTLTVLPSQTFYLYADYGAVTDSIVLPSAPSACTWEGWNGTSARFRCTAPASGGSYTYNSATVNYPPPGSNICAGGPNTVGTLTVNTPVNGACGTANNKTYPASAIGYAPDTQCAAGTSTNTAFPAVGSSVSWVCNGANGGTNSGVCSASRSAPSQPTISLNPNTFSFSGVSGGATPAAQTMTIRNTGTAALNWTSGPVPGKPGSWCHVSPASGSLSAGSQQTVSISVDSPSNVGTFTDCGIRISDPNATNNPQDVSVTYTVAPPPAVCPSASVTLAASSIIKGTTTQASAPTGWSGGSFASSNTGVATISGTTVSGVNTGTSNITGSGWTASNGATGCALSAQTLTVTNLTPPTNLGGVNSGAGLSCGQIKVTWTDNAVGEAGFKVYRNTANDSASATLIATVPSTSSLTTGTNYSYTDTPPAYNVAYYYWVTAYVGSIESSRDSGATGSINNTSCEANLNTSDKDIASVNGVINSTNTCQNNGEFPTNVQFKAGDTIGFNINLCNTAPSSGGLAASTITIDDTLYNLARYDSSKSLSDPAAWNASVTGGLSIASITPSGTEPDNLRLHIVLSGNLPAGSSAKLTFYAKVAFPANFSGTSSRFQNAASISYNNGRGMVTVPVTKSTPLLLFTSGPGPTKIETSP